MTESEIQKAVFAHLKQRGAPGAKFWCVPNTPAARRIPGYLAGVADVSVVHRGEFFALELKKENGRATEEQMKFVSDINAADGFGFIAYGLPAALACLESWGVLRREAT